MNIFKPFQNLTTKCNQSYNMEEFGLSEANFNTILNVFRKFDQIDSIKIYGSRAKGNFSKGSDIDLCLIGEKIDFSLLRKIESALEELLIPYKFDLSLYHTIDNQDLIEHINRVGKIFYSKNIIKNIIFDFGGVLVDWNPRYLYQSVFNDDANMEFFLKNICHDQWNVEQDGGRSLAEGTQILLDKHPEYSDLIKMYYDQWEVMLHSDIPQTVEILHQLKPHYHLYGLTNWSAETFPIAFNRYSFFSEFDGIVVSGDEKLIKPDPKIFELILDRYHLNAEETIFIDDNINNINQAKTMGFNVIHFINSKQLKNDLNALLNKQEK